MTKPVQNEEFWKKRINEIESDEKLYQSVYFCSKFEWDIIENKHLIAINKNIKKRKIF
jgi:hypothetical protein